MKPTKKILAFVLSAIMMLSMVTVASAAETKTISADGAARYSVTNVLSHTTTYEEYEGEPGGHYMEVFECSAPVTVTVLSDGNTFDVIDNTYYMQSHDDNVIGFIMPDGRTEEEYWNGDRNASINTTYTITEPGLYTMCVGLGTYVDEYYEGELVQTENTIYAEIKISGAKFQTAVPQ